MYIYTYICIHTIAEVSGTDRYGTVLRDVLPVAPLTQPGPPPQPSRVTPPTQ